GTEEVRVDMRAVRQRKDRIVGHSTQSLESWLRSTENLTVVQGQARVVAPRTVQVGESRFAGKEVLIDVGGRPEIPPLPGIDGVPYLTSDSMMDLDRVPTHLVIVGGSYIGLEFGQMFRRFGAAVTIVEMGPRLLAREDPDVSEEIRKILVAEGITVRL